MSVRGWSSVRVGIYSPQSIGLHRLHKLLRRAVEHSLRSDADAAIGVEDVETAVLFEREVDYALHVRFFADVYLMRVDGDVRVEGVELALMRFEVLGVEIAEEDGFGAILGEEMRGCPSDSNGGVGAGDDDDFAFESAAVWSVSVLARGGQNAYGPVESPAIRGILGMSSNLPGS